MIEMNQQEIAALVTEAIKTEKERIVGILTAAGNIAQLDGDIDAAQILAEAIRLIEQPEGEMAVVAEDADDTGVEEMFADENNQAKHEFDRELIGELPPDHLRTDDEDIARFLAKPAMPQPLPR